MSNYEYIVASLPDITTGWKFGEKGPEDYIEEIVSLCSDKDRELIGFFLDGYRDESLCTDFYARALTHDNVFIREFFRFDLNVRNTKVNYLNKALDRPAGKDILTFPEETDQKILDAVGEEFEESADLESFVSGELAKVLKGGVEASFSKKIAGGFTIGPKDGGYFISFTEETFNALISEYLRPATKKILFG